MTKDEPMKTGKLVLAAALAALVAPGALLASCPQTTIITNLSNVTMRIVELKSSSSPPVFKSQWTGLRVIPPNGGVGSISWVSDLNCNDALGNPNIWDLKLYRSIGQVHYCSRLTPSQMVSIDAPNNCS
jgi:hypothetical protein